MKSYVQAGSLDEALALRRAGYQAIAGGTDIYPALGAKVFAENIVDLTGLHALRGIGREGGVFRIGALTTWTDLAEARLPEAFRALQQAARMIGGWQIQNTATVAGNLCNASPAADGVPPLLALDAAVEIAGSAGSRRLPLAAFIQGNRRTVLAQDELVTAILIPDDGASARSWFEKLGSRSYLVISFVMGAVWLKRSADGHIEEARVAVGACSEVAQRLTMLEADLRGVPISADLQALLCPRHFDDLSPIDDVRAPAAYRRVVVRELIARALARCAEQFT